MSSNNTNNDDIRPPRQENEKVSHCYNLRPINVNFETQEFHFDKPRIAINDLNPLQDHSIVPEDDIPIHLQPDTHVFLKSYGESTNNLSDNIDSKNGEYPPKTIDLEDYELILRDEHWEPQLDEEGNQLTVVYQPPSDIL